MAKTKRPMVSDLDLFRAAMEGYAKLRELNSDMKCPYLATSAMSDAWMIGAWCAYHTGKQVRAIAASRGRSIRADIPGLGVVILRVIDTKDHRNCVDQLVHGEWDRAL